MSPTKHPLPIQNKKYEIYLSTFETILICIIISLLAPFILALVLIVEMIAFIALFFVDERKYVSAIGRELMEDEKIDWHG